MLSPPERRGGRAGHFSARAYYPDTVWYEIQQNLPVIALLIFMVSFIYFMKPLLSFIFARIIVGIQNKVALSLLFSFMAAFLSAFLDALTVTAVLIAVFVALYGVYERVVTSQSEGETRAKNHSRGLEHLSAASLCTAP